MEGKNAVLIVCMILLAVTVVGQYYWRLHDKEQDLSELRVLLSQARNTLQAKENVAKARERNFEAGRALADDYKALAEEHATLTKEVAELDAQFRAIQKDFVNAVVKVREKAPEDPPRDIVLRSGFVLNGSRIQKITNVEVSIQHAGGVSRVDFKDLPPELADRLRHDLPPFGAGGARDPAPAPPAPPPPGRVRAAPSKSTKKP